MSKPQRKNSVETQGATLAILALAGVAASAAPAEAQTITFHPDIEHKAAPAKARANPTIFIKRISMEKPADQREYLVADKDLVPPSGEYEFVGSFCPILARGWLTADSPTWRFSNYTRPEQLAHTKAVIAWGGGCFGMAPQRAWAKGELETWAKAAFVVTTPPPDDVSKGVIGAEASTKYPPGTKIWAGNNTNTVAFIIVDADQFKLYDPDDEDVSAIAGTPTEGIARAKFASYAVDSTRYGTLDEFIVVTPRSPK